MLNFEEFIYSVEEFVERSFEDYYDLFTKEELEKIVNELIEEEEKLKEHLRNGVSSWDQKEKADKVRKIQDEIKKIRRALEWKNKISKIFEGVGERAQKASQKAADDFADRMKENFKKTKIKPDLKDLDETDKKIKRLGYASALVGGGSLAYIGYKQLSKKKDSSQEPSHEMLSFENWVVALENKEDEGAQIYNKIMEYLKTLRLKGTRYKELCEQVTSLNKKKEEAEDKLKEINEKLKSNYISREEYNRLAKDRDAWKELYEKLDKKEKGFKEELKGAEDKIHSLKHQVSELLRKLDMSKGDAEIHKKAFEKVKKENRWLQGLFTANAVLDVAFVGYDYFKSNKKRNNRS